MHHSYKPVSNVYNTRSSLFKNKNKKTYASTVPLCADGKPAGKGKFPTQVTVVMDSDQLHINYYDTTHWCQSKLYMVHSKARMKTDDLLKCQQSSRQQDSRVHEKGPQMRQVCVLFQRESHNSFVLCTRTVFANLKTVELCVFRL